MSVDAPLEEALERLGAKRVEAVLLAAMLRWGAQGTRELVDRTGLRQPEVSVGMQILRGRGWVEAEPMPRRGKGRPMHRYSLVADGRAMRQHFEAHAADVQGAIKAALDVMRAKFK